MKLFSLLTFNKWTAIKAWCILMIGLTISGMEKLHAQPAHSWIWGNSGAGAEVASRCSKPVLDQEEHAYIIGSFKSNGEALSFSNSTTSLINFNPDVFTIFVAKYDKDGNLIWAKSFKSGDADAELIAVDTLGSIYCSGTYKDSISIDNITLNGNSSQYTQFLAKFTTTGELVWAKNITSAAPGYYLYYEALEIDASNNILMAGSFNQGNVLFDNALIHNSNNAATSYDYFVTRFNPDGNALWATSGGSPDRHDFARSLCISPADAFYVGTIYQDTGVVINGGQISIYKYDNTNTVIWNEVINSATGVGFGAITTDREGDLYLTGSYSGTLELDSLVLDEEDRGCFVVKYNAMGDALWADASTTNAIDVSVFTTGISVDYAGNVSISGAYVYSFLTPVTTLTFDTITLTLQGNRDAFLVQYNSDGDVAKAMSIGGIYSDFGVGLSVLSNGTIYYTGSFYSPTLALDSVTLTNTPNADGNYFGKFYLAKYGKQEGTGIDDRVADDSWLSVYPNPTKGDIIIDAAASIKAIKVIDPLGRQVLYEAMPAGVRQHKLSIGTYAKGLYYVYAYAVNGYVVKAVIMN